MACDQSTFEQELADLKAQLTALNAMFLAFLQNGAIQEYTLDTGQTVTRVKRSELSQFRLLKSQILSDIAMLEARVNGCGVFNGGPSW